MRGRSAGLREAEIDLAGMIDRKATRLLDDERAEKSPDDRPPICPACGVTTGIVMDEAGKTRYRCLECGFADGV